MFRSYARFGVVVQLMTALLAGIGADRLWRSGRDGARAGRIACVALLLLTAVDGRRWPPAMWRDVLPTAAHRWVTRQSDLIRVLDCAALTQESDSIQWLTGNRVALEQGRLDDCAEPNIGDKLSAAGFTHLLLRRDTDEGAWFAKRGPLAGLNVAAHFADGDVFSVRHQPPLIYTFQILGFYGREFGADSTWRWMGPAASWTIAEWWPTCAAGDARHRARRVQSQPRSEDSTRR